MVSLIQRQRTMIKSLLSARWSRQNAKIVSKSIKDCATQRDILSRLKISTHYQKKIAATKCLISWCAIFATSRGTTQMCDCRSTGFPNSWNFQRSMRSLKRGTNQTLCILSWRAESRLKALSPSIKIFPQFSTPWKTEMPSASWQLLITTKLWTILAGLAISGTPKLLPRMQLGKNCQSPTKEWQPVGRLKNQDWSGFQLRRPNESFSQLLKRNQSILQAPYLKHPRCNTHP